MTAAAENALNALKRREANKHCVNCGDYNKLGHSNVVEKTHAFVCSNCKSAHQSFSMRVKSVSMSNWTDDEVNALREEQGGGNAAAARVWLAHWDESKLRRPTAQDKLEYFKQFVQTVYLDRAFYDEAGLSKPQSQSRSQSRSQSSSASDSARTASPGRRRASRRSSPKPSRAAVANLLDFDAPVATTKAATGSFDAFSGSEWSTGSASGDDWANFSSAPAPVSSTSSSPHGDGFAAFSSAPMAPAAGSDGFADFSSAKTVSPTRTSDADGFGAFMAAPAPAPAPAAFDPFATSGSGLLAPTPASNAFDPFAPVKGASPPASHGQFQTPPAKDFSAFDGLSAPSLAYGQPQSAPSQHPSARMGMHAPAGQHYNGNVHAGGFQQPQMAMGGGNASMNISTYFAPTSVAVGGSSSARGAARDPFAGLGLPQH